MPLTPANPLQLGPQLGPLLLQPVGGAPGFLRARPQQFSKPRVDELGHAVQHQAQPHGGGIKNLPLESLYLGCRERRGHPS